MALDLKESRISLPFLGWEKGPGVPATASFLMEKTATGTEITNFLLSGKGFEASGTLSFGLDGRLKTMELEKIALRPGDQLTVSAVANGSGYDVRVRGAALDARGILQGVRSGSVGGTADIFPIAINLDVEVVKGQNDVALSNVAGTLTITSKGLDAASLKGKTNENQSFEWTLGREGDTRVLRLLRRRRRRADPLFRNLQPRRRRQPRSRLQRAGRRRRSRRRRHARLPPPERVGLRARVEPQRRCRARI